MPDISFIIHNYYTLNNDDYMYVIVLVINVKN